MFEYLTINQRLQDAEKLYKQALAQQQDLEDALIELAIRSEGDGEDFSEKDTE